MTMSANERRTMPAAGSTGIALADLIPAARRGEEQATAPAVPSPHWPADARPALRLCRCEHEEDAHEHYRGGDECGICSAARCRSFRLRTGRRARSSARR